MQSKRVPGLYMVGELLDVDGICGGYNPQGMVIRICSRILMQPQGRPRIQKTVRGQEKQVKFSGSEGTEKTKKKNIHMIRINQLTLPVDHAEEAIKKKAAKLLKIDESAIGEIQIVHRSIDARKKPNLLFSYIVDVTLAGGKRGSSHQKAANQNVRAEDSKLYAYPEHGTQEKAPGDHRGRSCRDVRSAGTRRKRLCPDPFEQGDAVEERTKVEDFWKNGDPALDIRSNVQFGEGGAGTFSDGKLNTLVKDTSGRNGKVLSTFVEMGADPSILYDHAPHIGTDVLREVVRNLKQDHRRRRRGPFPLGSHGDPGGKRQSFRSKARRWDRDRDGAGDPLWDTVPEIF